MARMRRYFLLFILLGCQPAGAQLAWKERNLEFQAAPGETNLVARFEFENTGTSPVTLRSVRSSCGCTAIVQDKRLYEPGEKGEITANFGFGQYVGLQKRSVLVQSDDRTEPAVTLSFRIRIPELLKITPPMVCWLKEDSPEPKTIHLKIGSEAPLHILGVQSSQAALTAQLKTVKKDEEYQIVVTPADMSKSVVAVLRIATDFPAEKPRTFIAYAMIKERPKP
jgi:hypothetical protein